MAQLHASPPSYPRLPPAHSLSPPISTVPTTELTLDHLSVLCRPVFEEVRLNKPMLAWAGIFGSVQRGTQRPDSDVDFLVGYSAGADFLHDMCGSYTELQRSLSNILGREVDVVMIAQDNRDYAYIHMEALLTAETIWGDTSWVQSSREFAERQLREGYEAMKMAVQVASRLKKRLSSSQASIDRIIQAEFESPENKTLRLSILEDALLIITTVKIPKHPFYYALKTMIPRLLFKQDVICAALEGELESSGDIEDI